MRPLIFSQHDVDLLRILYWCQYLSPAQAEAVFSKETVCSMVACGLIKRHSASGAYVLTGDGKGLLQRLFPGELPCFSQSYHAEAIQRRLRLSALMLTFYQASFQVFTCQRDALAEPGSFFLPSVARGRGQNPWGSTRIAAISNLGTMLCAVHYVCLNIGRLALNDELTAFHNQTSRIAGLQRSFLFAGPSYGEILSELQSTEQARGSLIRYEDAYRLLRMPVYLLSCDRVGAQQLRLMSIPSYRDRLSRAALQGAYRPPPSDVPEWDAMYDGRPFVLGADMDLRRIDAAIEAAHRRGYPGIAIAALEKQNAAILSARYRDTGLAHTYSLSSAVLEQVYGQSLAPAPDRPFFTKEGDVVHAPLIRADR